MKNMRSKSLKKKIQKTQKKPETKEVGKGLVNAERLKKDFLKSLLLI